MLTRRMIVHDKRLAGAAVPAAAQNIYEPDGDTPIAHCVAWVATCARGMGKLDQLVILCHGYAERYGMIVGTVREDFVVGGFGLQLCKEGLNNSNVSVVSPWKGLIGCIMVHGCAAADTSPGTEETRADGSYLMAKLAGFSGADVIASSDLQHSTWDGSRQVFDFSSWEGQVWRFAPGGDVIDREPIAKQGLSLYLDR